MCKGVCEDLEERTEEASSRVYRIHLYGKPKGKKRHRVSVVKGKPWCYDEQKYDVAFDRKLIFEQLLEQGFDRIIDSPVSITFIFGMGHSKGPQSHLIGQPKPVKPDIDNLEKYYLDVMNDLVYIDDKQVTRVVKDKIFSQSPYLAMIIQELPHPKNPKARCVKK